MVELTPRKESVPLTPPHHTLCRLIFVKDSLIKLVDGKDKCGDKCIAESSVDLVSSLQGDVMIIVGTERFAPKSHNNLGQQFMRNSITSITFHNIEHDPQTMFARTKGTSLAI